MQVVVLPYLRLRHDYDSDSYNIGPVRIVDDNDHNWKSVIGCERPNALNMFRDFASPIRACEPSVRRGIVLCSSDTSFLSSRTNDIVSSLYFAITDRDNWLPAESFTYYNADSDPRKMQMLGFQFKRALAVESETSLWVTPPLAVRATGSVSMGTSKKALIQKISDIIEHNSGSRLFPAMHQYMLGNMNQSLVMRELYDAAAFAAAVEAGLNLDSSPGSVNRFVDVLSDRLGSEPVIKQFLREWYIARSVYVHGSSHSADGDQSDSSKFKKRPYGWEIMAAIARDVIMDAIEKEYKSHDAYVYSRGFFDRQIHTAKIWDRLDTISKQKGSVDRLVAMEASELRSLSEQMDDVFAWGYIRTTVNQNAVVQIFSCLVRALVKLTEEHETNYLCFQNLANASHNNDTEAIGKWLLQEYDEQAMGLAYGTKQRSLCKVLARVGQYFLPPNG